jgi:superfamily II DNA or RNA helicase
MTLINFDYKLPELRQWQLDAVEQLKNSNRSVVAVFTGAGKGTLALYLIKQKLDEGKRCLFVVHSLSILNDIIAKAAQMGFNFGVVQAGNTRNIDAQFIIASSLSLIKRDLKFDYMCWDEAHIIYKSLFDYVQNNAAMEIVGFTATPFNAKMTQIFTNIVSPVTARQLTDTKVLVPIKIKVAKQIDTNNLATKGGEFVDTDIEAEGKKILGDIVNFWLEHASTRKTIIYAATINHADAIRDEFIANGIGAATYCATTNEDVRQDIVTKFKDANDNLMILTTVTALATGFDAPIASCIISCRPINKSFTLFVQSLGRILRSYDGKDHALYIDCDGNFDRFDAEYLSLYNYGVNMLPEGIDKINRHKKKKKKKQVFCPQCDSLMIANRCLNCGYIMPKTMLNHLTDNVKLIDKNFDSKDADQILWSMCCNIARRSRNKVWRAKFIYKDIVGDFPPAEYKFSPSTYVTKELQVFVNHRDLMWRAHLAQ